MNLVKYIVLAILLFFPFAWWYYHQNQSTQAKKSLIVGTNPQFPPFEFLEDGQLKGFDIDLINQIALELNIPIEWKSMPFDALIPGIQMGAIQVIAAGMTPTPAREQQILFTKPYLTGDPLAIITPASSTITSLEDLKNKSVVVNEGYTADFYMSKIEGPHLIRLETPLDAFMALEAGRADAFVAAKNSAHPFLEKYGYEKFKIIPISGTDEASAFGISKKHKSLLGQIQNVLNKLEQTGFITELKKKWKLTSDWNQK